MNRLLTPLVTEIFSLGTLLVLGTSSTSHAQDGEPLPYEATFEASNGFLPGSVNGQRGFSVERGQARVVPDEGRGDSAGLELSPSRPFGIVQLKVDPSSVLGERSPSDDHILHTEFYVRPGAVPGDEEDQFADVEGSLTGFFKVDEAGELFIYDGADSENGQGAWLPSGTKVALDESGSAADWIHLAFRQDFSRGLWDVAINGRIFRANLMMSDKAETLEAVEFIGQSRMPLFVDDVRVSRDPLVFEDADDDGLPDPWELVHGLVGEAGNRDADPDTDGLTNVEEWVLRTHPLQADTDGDGVSDGEEYEAGSDALAAETPDRDAAASLAYSGNLVLSTQSCSETSAGFQVSLYAGESEEITSFTGVYASMFSPSYQYLDASYHWVWSGNGEIWLNTPTYVESGRLDIGVSTNHGNTYYGSFDFSCDCGCGCLDVWGVGSVDFQLALGTNDFGKFGQYLQVKEPGWSERLYSRLSVRYAGQTNTKGESVLEGFVGEHAPKVLDWVRTDTQFTRLSDLPHGYLVESFHLDQVDEFNQVSGEPFKRYRIENPDPNGTERVKRLRVVEEIGRPSVREYRYRDSHGVEEWELYEGTAGSYLERPLRYTRMVSTTSGTGSTTQRLPETVEFHEVGHWDQDTGRLTIDEQTQRVYRQFPFGRRLVEEVRDPLGQQLRTRYGYREGFEPFDPKENAGGFAQIQPQWEERPDGGWTWYGYDASARRNRVVTPVGNTPRPDYLPGPGEGYRVVDTEFREEGKWRRVTESVNARIEKVTTLSVETSAEGLLREVTTISYSDGSERTTVRYEDALTRQLLRQENPDGTVVIAGFTEDGDLRRETRFEGTSDESNGKSTLTITHRSGLMMEKKVVDVASGVVLEHEKVLDRDPRFRPLLTANEISGKVRAAGYDCCDVEWVAGERGEAQVWERDVLGRVVGVREGFKDPLQGGNTLDVLASERRFNLDGPGERIETLDYGNGKGTDALVTHQAFNLARQLESTTSPDGVVSRQRTLHLPDGGRMELTSLARSGLDRRYRIHSRTFNAEGKSIRQRVYAGDEPFASTPAPRTQVKHISYDEGWDEQGRFEQVTDMANLFDHRTTRTYFDARDRRIAVIHAYGSDVEARESFDYDEKNQLRRHTDADGVVTRFAYNDGGEREITAIDLKREAHESMAHIDFDVDRITRVTQEVIANGEGVSVVRQTTQVYTEEGPQTIEVREESLDGLKRIIVKNGQRTVRQRLDGESPGHWSIVNAQPDGSHTVERFENALLVRTTRHASDGAILSWKARSYDGHGRLSTLTDSRTGTTSFHYDAKGRMWKERAPDPRTGLSGESGLDTFYHYDNIGQLIRVTKPGGGKVHQVFHANGTLYRVHGHHTTDVEYRYNGRGERTHLITRRDAGERPSETKWSFDARGRVAFKEDASGRRVHYAYTPAGKLKERSWARGVKTIYEYHPENGVDLVTVDYSDKTPDVQLTYTRLGMERTVQDAAGLTSYCYRDDAPWERKGETLSAELFAEEKTIIYEHDGLGRPVGLAVGTEDDPDQDYRAGYGYDSAGRLQSVHAGGYWFQYAYEPHSSTDLVQSVTAPFVKQTVFRYEQGRDAVKVVSNRVGFRLAEELSRFTYQNDADGQRAARTIHRHGPGAGVVLDEFRYDPDTGGLASSERHGGAQEQAFAYRYDQAGNRVAASINAQEQTYQRNILNQYERVNGERLNYDADGNLIARGDRTYTWDAENRLTAIRERGSLVARYTYDHQSRRVARQTQDGVAESYLYDGWNLIAVYRPDEKAPLQTYTWGKDLSGSLQGAGGVGGLLFAKQRGQVADAWIYHYDANGNVMEVTNAGGDLLDRYDYTPFGNVLGEVKLKENRWRFSTKCYDVESGNYYYGYRYYDPNDGRWLSRDPIEESGGINLYGFVENNAIGFVDLWGLLTILDGDDVEFDGPKFKFKYEIGVLWEIDGTSQNTRGVEDALAKFIKKKNKALGMVADVLLEGIKQLAPTHVQHQIAVVIFWECDCECFNESDSGSDESFITPASFGGSPFEGFDANNPLPDEMILYDEISSEKWGLWSKYLNECKVLCESES